MSSPRVKLSTWIAERAKNGRDHAYAVELKDAALRERAMSDDARSELSKALEELLAELKEVGGMGPATRTRGWLTPKDFPQRLRALYAAALQQHPRCYKPDSEPECFFEVDRGDKP